MADLIDSAQAKKMLGCDDATLNGYINNGSIRAQNQGGKLMILKDDVDRLSGDDGTIVITGDSSELQIDLEKTAASAANPQAKSGTQSITFGDDLEVVSFDDAGTKDLKYGNTTQPTKPASRKLPREVVTDANTEVMTAVDEPNIEVTEATHATSQSDRRANESGAGSARRSVRSSRAYVDEPKVSPVWPVVMLVTLGLTAGLVLPYVFLKMTPHGVNQKDYAGNTLRGADDGFMAGLASTAAGFSVEPDRERYKKVHGSEEGYQDIRTIDSNAEWRIAKYRAKYKGGVQSFTITEVTQSDDNGNPVKVKSANGEFYDVVPQKITGPAGEQTEYKVQISSAAAPEAAPK